MGLDVGMNVSVGDTGGCGGGGGGKWRAPPDNTVQVVKAKHLRDIDDEVIPLINFKLFVCMHYYLKETARASHIV